MEGYGRLNLGTFQTVFPEAHRYHAAHLSQSTWKSMDAPTHYDKSVFTKL